MRPFAVILAAGFACALSLRAQTQASQQAPTFSGRVDLVPLDVTVWDKNGHPVKGLTADKFTVLEDGKPREIATFASVDIPDPPPPAAEWMRDAPVDVVTNDVQNRRLFMILIDDASFGQGTEPGFQAGPDGRTPVFQSAIDKVKRAARAFIDRLGPSDLAAVFFTADNRRSQDFTSDHGRLLAAVDSHWAPSMPAELLGRGPVLVLRRAVEALLNVPARRKALVLLTQFDPVWMEQAQIGVIGRGANAGSGGQHDFLIAHTENMFADAQRAGINLYTVRLGELREPDYWEGSWFKRVAKETGGEALGDAGSAEGAERAASRVFQANSSYYILGYSSADLKKFHFIKVLVDRDDVQVRTREKYYWPEPKKRKNAPAPPPLTKSIAGVLPDSDVLMRTSPAAFMSTDGKGAVVVAVTSIHVTAPPPAAPRLETFNVRTNLFTTEGQPRGFVTTPAPVRHTGEEFDTEVLASVPAAKPGLYEVRIAARRNAADLDGSVYASVDVPDFAKLPVSFSSVIVSTSDWPGLGRTGELAKLLPAMPTAERDFARGTRARAFVRVYQGGKGSLTPVDVKIRIIDEHDNPVVDRIEKLVSTRFSKDRSADVRVDLPTLSLPPGLYLLRIETAIDQTTAKREVRFSVR